MKKIDSIRCYKVGFKEAGRGEECVIYFKCTNSNVAAMCFDGPNSRGANGSSRKVSGSIPGRIIHFYFHNFSVFSIFLWFVFTLRYECVFYNFVVGTGDYIISCFQNLI